MENDLFILDELFLCLNGDENAILMLLKRLDHLLYYIILFSYLSTTHRQTLICVCVDGWRKYFGRKRAQLSLLSQLMSQSFRLSKMKHTHMHTELAYI